MTIELAITTEDLQHLVTAGVTDVERADAEAALAGDAEAVERCFALIAQRITAGQWSPPVVPVKFFAEGQAPRNPLTGLPGEPGWYWRNTECLWDGPAPGGKHGKREALARAGMPGAAIK